MKKIQFTLLVILLALSACSSKKPATKENTNPNLIISDPAKKLEAIAGNEFKIVIDSNPTTGYHWEIVGKLDASVVKFISKEFKGSEPVMPGSGGRDIFTFKALKTGQTLITLEYYPPSNDPVEPQQTVSFTVTVK